MVQSVGLNAGGGFACHGGTEAVEKHLDGIYLSVSWFRKKKSKHLIWVNVGKAKIPVSRFDQTANFAVQTLAPQLSDCTIIIVIGGSKKTKNNNRTDPTIGE